MTERDYQCLLDAVERAVTQTEAEPIWIEPSQVPLAANDNGTEWLLAPFPDGWTASP